MSCLSANRFKSLSAEYVEESYRNAPDVSETEDLSTLGESAPDVSEAEDINLQESAPDVSEESDVALDESYLDLLLESLNDEE